MQTWIPVSAQCGRETCFQAAGVRSPFSWEHKGETAQKPSSGSAEKPGMLQVHSQDVATCLGAVFLEK